MANDDREEEETFQRSFPGPSGTQHDTLYWRTETDLPPEREFEDIMFRRVPRAVAHHFRGAAGARALTHAQYLGALVELHQAARRRADAGDEAMAALLEGLGLGTISI